jgi:hypothetical protein
METSKSSLFEGMYYFNFQVASTLLGSLLDLEAWGSMFLQNINELLLDYRACHATRLYSY